jgi:hypothetical protein
MVSGPLPATTCSICWIPSTSAARLRAAFTSRSTSSPHAWQRKVRSARDSLALTVPQPEQVFDDAKKVSASTSRPPAHRHL